MKYKSLPFAYLVRTPNVRSYDIGDYIAKVYFDEKQHSDGVSFIFYIKGSEYVFDKENSKIYTDKKSALEAAKDRMIQNTSSF